MAVIVLIQDANVYYHPQNGGDLSKQHHLMALPAMQAVDFDGVAPVTKFTISTKRGVVGEAAKWLRLTEEDFTRFKNGGKRLPTSGNKVVVHEGGLAFGRERDSRENHPVREGDVGPYKRGPGHLYKANLETATNDKPANWAPGASGTPGYYETDPSHPEQLNRDHQNNQKSLKKRKASPEEGMAIAIPQWIHTNGYTFGNKAKDGTKKQRNADSPGQSRSEWIAAHPSEALFKEMYQTIRAYADSGNLSYEIVGAYRYLYKKNVKNGYTPTPQLDNLIMHYLALAW